MAETKPPVPSSVDLPKGTNSAWGNGNKKNRGNSGKTGSGNSNNSNSDATTVDKQFRNDSQDLGVMLLVKLNGSLLTPCPQEWKHTAQTPQSEPSR
mmetsp:Transcript_48917/g.118435  ORF Transcript_48917/g.118435 Transcript_48917/m.118435 type:complete len:96 (+) Transcript_48917:3086-3373(+)